MKRFLELAYWEARAAAGQVVELAAELRATWRALPTDDPWRRNLCLMEQALRRDQAFLIEHPEALLQCLWHRCWWYDAPEAAAHYEQPQALNPPWQRPEPRLSTLLEQWREEKQRREPGFVWYRSLRPPRLQLGSGELSVLDTGRERVDALLWLPGSARIMAGTVDGQVSLFDASSGQRLAARPVPAPPARQSWPPRRRPAVTGLASSPDGRLAYIAANDGWWRRGLASATNLEVGRAHEHASAYASRATNKAAIAANPQVADELALASEDGVLAAYKATGEVAWCREVEWTPSPCLAYSADGTLLAIGDNKGRAHVLRADSGDEIAVVGHGPNQINGIAFVAATSDVAFADNAGFAQRWRLDGRQPVWHTEVSASAARCLVASASGTRLAIGCADRTVVVLDADGKQLGLFGGHEAPVTAVAFAGDDDELLASASDDGAVMVWRSSEAAVTLSPSGDMHWGRHAEARWLGPTLLLTATDHEPRESSFWQLPEGTLIGIAPVVPYSGLCADVTHDGLRLQCAVVAPRDRPHVARGGR